MDFLFSGIIVRGCFNRTFGLLSSSGKRSVPTVMPLNTSFHFCVD